MADVRALRGAIEVLRVLVEDLEACRDLQEAKELVRRRLQELEERATDITRTELGWVPLRLLRRAG